MKRLGVITKQEKKPSDISFFTFPKDTSVRKQWAHYCRRKDFIPGKGHRVCSVHLTNECFDKDPELKKGMGLKFNKQY